MDTILLWLAKWSTHICLGVWAVVVIATVWTLLRYPGVFYCYEDDGDEKPLSRNEPHVSPLERLRRKSAN